MEFFDPSNPDDDNPFSDMSFLNEIFKSFSQQGGQSAKQIAMAIASGGTSEPNVDPVERMEFENLLRVAELHVNKVTGLTPSRSGSLTIEPVTKAGWATHSLDALKPLLVGLASIGTDNDIDLGDFPSEINEMMALLAPMMAEMTTGTMVGHLASRCLGTYDLPIPREDDRILLVAPNIDSFGEDWSIPKEDLRLWICLHEVTHHAVLGIPHIRKNLSGLLTQHAESFSNDPSVIQDQLGEIEIGEGLEGLASLQNVLNPEMVLGAVRSPQQEALLPYLEALVAVVIGFVDYTMDQIGNDLIPSYPRMTEALRRRRVETGEAERFVEKILGLNLTQEQVDRGVFFIGGVVERAGSQGLDRLWVDESNLPTPSEVDAPGLWLARLDLETGD
ncbi:MAG: zinc-dependent metalloprotease [Acidimicrobiales bacterium]|nr:zinc-dependent metalloprotease [Acidimicrobiales bacterium]